MKDGKCLKRFPKPFRDETETAKDGYPLYRRRKPENGRHQLTKKNVKYYYHPLFKQYL